ncbi:MAG: hypothetical protein DHS20C15_09520 [Planctomycetota bacterium]|nr:MAG: hypothetical protein DHS20C15_09520 [Planctomycetota bacterium]
MATFNSITSAIFDPILGLFGFASAWIDILLWSIGGGIVALLVYKHISNQKGIERAKNGIKVHLLEIRLFQDDLLGVVLSTLKILWKNALYIGHNVMPMIVMFIPMMTILFQLEANYALDPVQPGTQLALTVELDRSVTDASQRDIQIAVPAGVTLGRSVRARPGHAIFDLVADEPGDHEIQLTIDGVTETKGLAVGGEPRKVPYLRTKSWEGYLYPGEAALDGDSPFKDMRFGKGQLPDRDLGVMPGGEGGILMVFFVLSIAAGLALKGVFGVTL